jgi:hypothetical protein
MSARAALKPLSGCCATARVAPGWTILRSGCWATSCCGHAHVSNAVQPRQLAVHHNDTPAANVCRTFLLTLAVLSPRLRAALCTATSSLRTSCWARQAAPTRSGYTWWTLAWVRGCMGGGEGVHAGVRVGVCWSVGMMKRAKQSGERRVRAMYRQASTLAAPPRAPVGASRVRRSPRFL